MAQVFIAHSSKDQSIVMQVKEALKRFGVGAYLAELESPTSFPLPNKIQQAIEGSDAIIAVLTKNVIGIQQTRDVVNWEISAAYHLKKPVYVFRENGVDVPLMISYITDYFTFDPIDEKNLKEAISKVYEIGSELKETEDKKKAVLTLICIAFGIVLLSNSK